MRDAPRAGFLLPGPTPDALSPNSMERVWMCLAAVILSVGLHASDLNAEPVDATDPTKIYSFFGGGPKYSEFTNGDYLREARVIGNIGFSEKRLFSKSYNL